MQGYFTRPEIPTAGKTMSASCKSGLLLFLLRSKLVSDLILRSVNFILLVGG